MNSPLYLILLIALLITAGAILLLLDRQRGLPAGKVIYEDLTRDGVPSRTLTSVKYGLTGKPDLIIQNGKELIPVEIKHAAGGERPRPSHVLQLAVYCLLIGEEYRVRPSRGIIRYRDKQFEIPFTKALENELQHTIISMRNTHPEEELPPRCSDRKKCPRCGYAQICKDIELKKE